jgi:hypothetical protein
VKRSLETDTNVTVVRDPVLTEGISAKETDSVVSGSVVTSVPMSVET